MLPSIVVCSILICMQAVALSACADQYLDECILVFDCCVVSILFVGSIVVVLAPMHTISSSYNLSAPHSLPFVLAQSSNNRGSSTVDVERRVLLPVDAWVRLPRSWINEPRPTQAAWILNINMRRSDRPDLTRPSNTRLLIPIGRWCIWWYWDDGVTYFNIRQRTF